MEVDEEESTIPLRAFGLGAQRVEIVGPDITVAKRLDQLFGAMPDPPADPAGTIVVTVRAIDDGYETTIDGTRCGRGARIGVHETAIASRLNRLLLDHESDVVHLHAGAVAQDGAGVVLLGCSGSGKSTLTAHLTRQGWGYLTDEMVGLEPDPLRIRPYPRPITLKQGSWPLFPDAQFAGIELGHRPGDKRLEIPPSMFDATIIRDPLPPSLVVSLQRRDAHPTIRPLSPSQALLALVEDSLDLERAGLAGMASLVALAAAVPAIEVGTTDLGMAERRLLEELGRAIEPCQTRYIAPAPDRSLSGHAWEFVDRDGSGVIYDIESGQVLAVDRSGLAVWEAMSESRSLDEILRAVGAPDHGAAGVEQFVANLVEHQILR